MIERWAHKLGVEVHSPWTIRWTRNCLFMVVVYFITVLALPNLHYFWGTHSLIPALGFPDGLTYRVIMFLQFEGNEHYYPYFFIAVCAGLLIYVSKLSRRWATFLVWLGMMVLYNRAYLSLVGGNYLLHALLFYLFFADEKSEASGKWGFISHSLSNLALWACRIQVIYVYVFSGAYKWASEQWRSGEAVSDIMHLKEFSLPWIMDGPAEWHTHWVMVNYLAMAYFSLFPFLVWSKKWKMPLLIFGVIWHLGMGWAIGVMDFSLVMIASYAVFIEKDDMNRLKALFTKRIKVSRA